MAAAVEQDRTMGLDALKPSKQGPRGRNVGPFERLASVVSGGILTVIGARRRGAAGALMAGTGLGLMARGATAHCPAYSALGLNSASEGRFPKEVHVERSVTIQRSPEDLYRFWRNLENLPSIMRHLKSVRVTGDGRSHWVAQAPGGRTVEWDAEIINDVPDELIAWRSLEGASVPNAGSVRFQRAPGGRGTEVHVSLNYNPPAGSAGVLLAKAMGEEPSVQVSDDLMRLKQLMEAGEVARVEGQPVGRH